MKKLEIKNQNGRSMIEMLGVLAIIGVLSVGGIAGYSKAMTKYRINKTIEQITLIAGNIRSFFAPQGNYEGLYCTCGTASGICRGQSDSDGCPVIKKAKIFPDEMITVDSDGKITAITNAFGERTGLYLEDKDQEDDYQAFRIDYEIGNNEEACIELLTYDWKTAGVSFFMLGNPMYVFETIPASLDNVVNVCSKYSPPFTLSFFIDADINCYKTGVCCSDFLDSTYY